MFLLLKVCIVRRCTFKLSAMWFNAVARSMRRLDSEGTHRLVNLLRDSILSKVLLFLCQFKDGYYATYLESMITHDHLRCNIASMRGLALAAWLPMHCLNVARIHVTLQQHSIQSQ